MQICETVIDQAGAMKLPLVAVTVTAVARRASPFLLMLHWHGFQRLTPLKLPGVELPRRPVPQSTSQFELPGGSLEGLERSTIEAAWQLGAWDVERLERRAWYRPGAPATEVTEGHRAFGYFGEPGDALADEAATVPEAPDRRSLMEWAARKGYIRWLFRPRISGVWAQVNDPDDTVNEQGGRVLPCPVALDPQTPGDSRRFVYRLGGVHRLLIPGH